MPQGVLDSSKRSQVDADRKCKEAVVALASSKEKQEKVVKELAQRKQVFWKERGHEDSYKGTYLMRRLDMINIRRSVRQKTPAKAGH